MTRDSRGTLPPRPLLPPALGGALGALSSSAAIMEWGWCTFCGDGTAAAPTAIAVTLSVLLLAAGVRLRSVSIALWVIVGVALGAASGFAGVSGRASTYEALDAVPVSALTLRLYGDPSETPFGIRSAAQALDGSGAPIGRVTVLMDEAADAGSMRAVGRVRPLASDEWGRRSYMGGTVAEVRVTHLIDATPEDPVGIDGVRRVLLERLRPERDAARALVAAIVCARTTELAKSGADEAFSQTGTSHLVAVSGGHLALVSALAVRLLTSVRARPWARAFFVGSAMGGYVIFTGCSPSAVRSYIMVLASIAAHLAGRRPHGPSGLSVATILLVLIDPGTVFDLGFQLSAASVFGIQVFSGYVQAILERVRALSALAPVLAVTLIAQIATLPITLPVFGEVSLIAPLANLVLGPLMSALLVCGLLGGAVSLIAPVSDLALVPATALARCSVFCATALAEVPGGSVLMDPESLPLWLPFAVCVLGGAVYRTWRAPRPRTVAAVACLICLLFAAAAIFRDRCAPAQVTVLDVGQADAILVRDGAASLLVDAGVDDDAARALARQGVMHLDAVVITHWDRDHWGGLPSILRQVSVGRIIVAAGAASAAPPELREERGVGIEEVSRGDTLSVGRFSGVVVWPAEEVSGEENADSLVMKLVYSGPGESLDVLLTGDAESAEAERFVPYVGDIDVLKLGHHGSAASVSAEMLAVLRPELSVASAGEGNRYGHPSDEALALLDAHGCPHLCTMDVGDIRIEPGRDGFLVSCARPGAPPGSAGWG